MVIREVTYLSILIRILAAFALGGIIGMERGMKNRPAGLRTYMLVCVGACLIMLTNQYIYQVFGTGDPVRMGSQVVSGIGFLGGGHHCGDEAQSDPGPDNRCRTVGRGGCGACHWNRVL